MALEDEPDLQARAQAMLDHCELVNVRVIEFAGKRSSVNEAASVNMSSETSYLAEDSYFGNRYEWRAQLIDDDGAEVAELTATIVVEYDVFEGFEPDLEAAEAIADSTGFFAAYPYVRELFQAGCSRLQLNPLVLGMLLRDATKPRAVTSPSSQA